MFIMFELAQMLYAFEDWRGNGKVMREWTTTGMVQPNERRN